MKKLAMRCALVTALAAGALAGCGGSSDYNSGDSGSGGSGTGIGQNVNDLIAYMKALIATDENGDAVDVNSLSLAVDETGEAAPL